MFPFRRRRRQTSRSQSSPASSEVLKVGDFEITVRRKAYRRSIGLTIKINGSLAVHAPKGTSRREIEDFVRAQENWIRDNTAKYKQLRSAFPPKRYSEGETFMFLGRPYLLHFVPSSRVRRVRFELRDSHLLCEKPLREGEKFDPHAPHPELATPIRQYYATLARHFISERVRFYADRMDLHPTGVGFRSQKTRWGSCSSKGRISLNWRLIIAPLEVIDYVVVHELAHLRHYNHSRAFWALVDRFVPHMDDARIWLREHQFDTDFLAVRSELYPNASNEAAAPFPL